jgi:glutaredoxin 3
MPPVVVYTTPYCSYCVSAKALLRRKGVEFTEINVAGVPDLRTEMVKRANGLTTVPQILRGPASSIHCWPVEYEDSHE